MYKIKLIPIHLIKNVPRWVLTHEFERSSTATWSPRPITRSMKHNYKSTPSCIATPTPGKDTSATLNVCIERKYHVKAWSLWPRLGKRRISHKSVATTTTSMVDITEESLKLFKYYMVCLVKLFGENWEIFFWFHFVLKHLNASRAPQINTKSNVNAKKSEWSTVTKVKLFLICYNWW